MNVPSPSSHVLLFFDFLRQKDFSIGIKESQQAVQTLNQLHEPDPILSRYILRSLSCRNHNEWQRFDRLFNQYWYGKKHYAQTSVSPSKNNEQPSQRISSISGIGGSTSQNLNVLDQATGLTGSGAGKQTTITKSDFRFITDQDQMRKLEHLAEKLALSLRRRLSRKYIYRKHGSKLDIRRSVRKNLSHAGVPVQPIYKAREYKPPRLVILHDISHSMTWSNPLLFRFARGLIRTFKSSEAFAFHIELFRVSELYRQHSLLKMREQLEENNKLWLGGTCIAQSIETFNHRFAKKILKQDSIILVLSDGFDTDAPINLAKALKTLKTLSKKIIWLSPILERQGHKPNNEAMETALGHIDALLPAHSLDSLKNSLHVIKQYC